MITKIEQFNKTQLKQGLPNIRPGDTVKIHQKIKEKGKERTWIFEGLVLAIKHGKGISSTIKVRKILSGVGVEKTIPIHSPNIEKIEIIKKGKVRRAKLYYLREAKGKRGRLKNIDFEQIMPETIEETIETNAPEDKKEVENIKEVVE
ncbi:50S ribosomal protein L19 [Patescibacteria group bacterium]|nr:50S ribosomal protein L19 [Patescibacteria group bacterium]MBU1876748.1 50S ribosomal protein L19 [Patescibacteria group bacterium]